MRQNPIYVDEAKTEMAELCERLTDKCNLFRVLGFESLPSLLGQNIAKAAKGQCKHKRINKAVIKRNEYPI